MIIKAKFYGIRCIAKISTTDFTLIGKTKVTQSLLDFYVFLVCSRLNFQNWFLNLFNIETEVGMKLGVIEVLSDDKDEEEKGFKNE